MPNMRKPAPRKTPTLLRELVRDLDDRLEGGDALSDVWMPHEEWARLVEQADEEMLEAAAENGAKKRAAANLPEKLESSSRHEREFEQMLEQIEAMERNRLRGELCGALSVGVDTSWPDLIEVAKGYAMALDAERERAVQRAAEVVAAARQERASPERSAKATAGDPDCPSCGAGEEQEPEHPRGCRTCGGAPYLVMVDGKLRAGHYTDRETAICWARDAMRFEAFSIVDASGEVFDRFAKCGVCQKVTDGHVTATCPRASGDVEEPEHPECPHCGEADGHKPADCAMRETDVEDDAPKAKKKRTSKKFPKRTGELEPCTKCGATFGEHAGQKCPPKQRRMKITDVEAEREGLPF